MSTDVRRSSTHASPEERAAAGRRARARTQRSSHGRWDPPRSRPDPVKLLERQARTRVAELAPIRYGRMLASPFAFFRGGAAIMAADLDDTPRSGLNVQLCGDAHLANFGGFAAPDRALVFDINDFDETLPGPWEWDVKRLAASFAVVGRERGFKEPRQRSIVGAAVREYREAMWRYAARRNLDVWYLRLDAASLLDRWRSEVDPADVKTFERTVTRAKAKDSTRALSKLAQRVNGELRIISDPPLIIPLEELLTEDESKQAEDRLRRIFDSYRASLRSEHRRLLESYRYVHGARKVVGVGSVGTRTWIALLVGRDDRDPLFLQVKEAQPSVLERYVSSSSEHQGQRVVEGQRLMQAASDIFLGWLSGTGLDGKRRDFYVRQLWDGKGSARVDSMSPRAMIAYAQLCGSILARAHARSGDRIAIAAYLGRGPRFDRAIADFAEAYADQNERDYAALRFAAGEGRVTAREGI